MIFKKNDPKSKPALEEIYEEIEQKQNGRDQLLIDLAAELTEYKEAERKASELNLGSLDVNDFELVKSANKAKSEAREKINFYEDVLSRARKEPLFDEAERREKAARIRDGVTNIQEEKFKTATELIEKAIAEVEEAHKAINEANNNIAILNRNATTMICNVDIITVSCVIRNLRAVLNSNPVMTNEPHKSI
jgi:hypothetical protein